MALAYVHLGVYNYLKCTQSEPSGSIEGVSNFRDILDLYAVRLCT